MKRLLSVILTSIFLFSITINSILSQINKNFYVVDSSIFIPCGITASEF